jgi:23S rRNA pseudouridine1911/1915/1917 synthase
MQEHTLTVSPEDANLRLDVFIFNFSQRDKLGLSRTFIQGLIEAGNARINSLAVTKPHHKIKSGDEIKLAFEEKKPRLVGSENIPLEIVYEDDDVAVINKPIGLVTHPAPGNYEHTLVNALLHRFEKLSDINPERPGIVHRLDKDTSGLLVIARNNASHLSLVQQFAKHSIKRRYIAVVSGKMEFDEGVIEIPIGRHPRKRKNMAVGFGKGSKEAKTIYRTLKRRDDFTLVELEPFTGRTHQLRVHLAFIGHPVAGDMKYGKPTTVFKRLCLHARLIGFIHPRTGKYIEFSCDVPAEFLEYFKNNALK